MLHRRSTRRRHLRSSSAVRPRRHRELRGTLAGVVLLALSITACGSDAASAPSPGPSPAPSVDASGRGWVDGEPDWHATGDASGGAGDEAPTGVMPASGAADMAVPEAATAGTAAAPGVPATSSPDGDQQAKLRAGSVDDNADYARYLEYLARYDTLGLEERPFDPSGRIVVTVTGANGLPVAGAPVTVTSIDQQSAPVEIAQLRTTARGQVILLPAEYGPVGASYTFSVDGVSADAAPGGAASLVLTTDGGASAGLPVDVLFLLDVTGSMGDEIAQLKTTIADVADQLDALPQQPDIRFGMTLFRDQGDAFVTSTFDLTDDLASFQQALDGVEADGGGDTPEAVDEAFAAALGEPTWRDPATTVQMIFLVGDAAPHVERQLAQAYPQSILAAAARGITVNVVAASQTDDPAEHAFREIAQGTGGRFVFLAYGAAGGTATGEHTDIASTDYEELSLDELVVRLVGEQLAALTGQPFVPPIAPGGGVASTDAAPGQ